MKRRGGFKFYFRRKEGAVDPGEEGKKAHRGM